MSRTAPARRIQVIAAIASIALAVSLLPWAMTATETSKAGEPSKEKNMTLNKLTADEERVILHKGTERAFTGKYWDHHDSGSYVCRQCGAELYKSSDKFDSGCGWPSFDDAVPGAVTRTLDADGHRIEITCSRCGGHLGHVFEGEQFTAKNTRHCVNSISLDFKPAASGTTTETAYFAGGCFWGVQHLLEKEDGVIATRVGYMGGATSNPTYKQVCDHNTGHAEAVEVIFDRTKTDYETLAKLFFEIHDPTQVNRQGPDYGDQYRSAIFVTSDDQKAVALKLIGILKDKGYKVATQVVSADTFWVAEDYHQQYYDRTGKEPYCHVYQQRF